VKSLRVSTGRREQMLDVTDAVRELVAASGTSEGICVVYSPHTTCGVTVNEGWDPDVQSDALQMARELIPKDRPFAHSEGNSDAHVKTMFMGASATLVVAGGELKLGRWQAIFLCEFDGPRERELWVTVR
jgi:secondary thiamine-phosphate synthase enzyme